jgi:hypothetical protein
MRSHSSSGALSVAEQHHARVVDHGVEPAELVDRPVDRGGRLVAIADVGLDHEAVDLARQRVQSVLAACRDRDRRALLRQRSRRRLSDSTARAGDQRDGSVQSFTHAAMMPRAGPRATA